MGCVQSYFRRAQSPGVSPSSTEESNSKGVTLDPSSVNGSGKKTPISNAEEKVSEQPESNDTSYGVEATAVGTLAASTGTVAILGTTAQVKEEISKGEQPAKEAEESGNTQVIEAEVVNEQAPDQDKPEEISTAEEEEVIKNEASEEESKPEAAQDDSEKDVPIEPSSPEAVTEEAKEEISPKENDISENEPKSGDTDFKNGEDIMSENGTTATVNNSKESKNEDDNNVTTVSDLKSLSLEQENTEQSNVIEEESRSISSEQLQTNSISDVSISESYNIEESNGKAEELGRLKTVGKSNEILDSAAVRIQSTFRGYKTRKSLRKEATSPGLTDSMIESVKREVTEICEQAVETTESLLQSPEVEEPESGLEEDSPSLAAEEESRAATDSQIEAQQTMTAVAAPPIAQIDISNEAMADFPPPVMDDEFSEQVTDEELPPPDFDALESSYTDDQNTEVPNPHDPLASKEPATEDIKDSTDGELTIDEDFDELRVLQKPQECSEMSYAIDEAAAKIQASVRGYLTRKKIQKTEGEKGLAESSANSSGAIEVMETSKEIEGELGQVQEAVETPAKVIQLQENEGQVPTAPKLDVEDDKADPESVEVVEDTQESKPLVSIENNLIVGEGDAAGVNTTESVLPAKDKATASAAIEEKAPDSASTAEEKAPDTAPTAENGATDHASAEIKTIDSSTTEDKAADSASIAEDKDPDTAPKAGDEATDSASITEDKAPDTALMAEGESIDSTPANDKATESAPIAENEATSSASAVDKATDNASVEDKAADSASADDKATESAPMAKDEATKSASAEDKAADSASAEDKASDSASAENKATDSASAEDKATDSALSAENKVSDSVSEVMQDEATPESSKVEDANIGSVSNTTEDDGTVKGTDDVTDGLPRAAEDNSGTGSRITDNDATDTVPNALGVTAGDTEAEPIIERVSTAEESSVSCQGEIELTSRDENIDNNPNPLGAEDKDSNIEVDEGKTKEASELEEKSVQKIESGVPTVEESSIASVPATKTETGTEAEDDAVISRETMAGGSTSNDATQASDKQSEADLTSAEPKTPEVIGSNTKEAEVNEPVDEKLVTEEPKEEEDTKKPGQASSTMNDLSENGVEETSKGETAPAEGAELPQGEVANQSILRSSGELHDTIPLPLNTQGLKEEGEVTEPEGSLPADNMGKRKRSRSQESNESQEASAATKIQANVRGYLVRKRQKAERDAAVKIQAGFRGFKVRQQMKQNQK